MRNLTSNRTTNMQLFHLLSVGFLAFRVGASTFKILVQGSQYIQFMEGYFYLGSQSYGDNFEISGGRLADTTYDEGVGMSSNYVGVYNNTAGPLIFLQNYTTSKWALDEYGSLALNGRSDFYLESDPVGQSRVCFSEGGTLVNLTIKAN